MNASPNLPDLSPEQREVMAAIHDRGENVLITGPAGSGKSTILRHLTALYRARLPICASTGIAAINVGGTTVHSWAGLGLGKGTAEEIAANMSKSGYQRIRDAGRLAIDEISMIGADLFTKLDQVCRIVRRTPEPFGGIQLILFGDFLQLPPVQRRDEGKGTGDLFTGQTPDAEGQFAFQSSSWKNAKIRTYLLRQVFRQADPEFAAALSDIRVGRLSERALVMLRSRFNVDDPEPHKPPVVLHTHNRDVDAINSGHLADLPGPPRLFQATDTGAERGIRQLQQNCIAPTNLSLKPGAMVMLLQNLDMENGLANGSTGILKGYDAFDRPKVEFFNGRTRDLDLHKWEIKEGGHAIAERVQYPLRLAWAITTHKSQGMTLDKAEVHLGSVFEYGQAYVALSRLRTKEGLFILSGGRGSIKAHPDALAFYGEK